MSLSTSSARLNASRGGRGDPARDRGVDHLVAGIGRKLLDLARGSNIDRRAIDQDRVGPGAADHVGGIDLPDDRAVGQHRDHPLGPFDRLLDRAEGLAAAFGGALQGLG
jgi:hypothetical protein